MKNNPDFYYFGKCKYCSKERALKNGVCTECEKKGFKIPKGFEALFDKFKEK